MGALVRETYCQWALLTAAWCNYMAFMCATVFYQLATFAAHPEQSLFWVASYGGPCCCSGGPVVATATSSPARW